ncbi:hypothetical protein EYR36_005960 [Pleurotus pulmonarius]|nr:hypothetical protein EYR36_005960 [Pleurotus pulmonarius]KAF4600668.1 hypothetical protein EYR38_005311 [Pleurotus pulmonarius]
MRPLSKSSSIGPSIARALYLQWPYLTRKNDQPLNLYTLTGGVDCPFRLTKFHWDCRFSVLFDLDGLAKFLEHQPSIEVLMLPSIQSSIKLSEQALPRLRVLWTTVVFAASVLPKRPVTHLRLEDIYSIPLTQRTAISSDMITKLKLLDLSSYFTIPSSVPPFTAGMVNLESLRVLIRMGDQEIRMLGDLPLHKLRRIHFSAWGDSQLGVNPAIILTLFKLIPSLECVIVELPYDCGKSTR